MEDLSKAEKKHGKQLKKYRRVIRTILREEPECRICFLDFCGNIESYPIGKDGAVPDIDDDQYDEPPAEKPESADYFFKYQFGSEPLFSYDA